MSTTDRRRVAIIGAGVIGLGIGWRLAQAGCAVDIFERDRAGRGASWAAAGMLAAGVETEPGEHCLAALTAEGLRRWPSFAAELESVSGIFVELRTEGTLAVATNADEAARLRHEAEFQRSLGIELHWLTGAEARRVEPHLGPGIAAAALSPRDIQVNNRQLVTALERAFEAAGGRLHEHARVDGIEVAGGRIQAIRLADRVFEAGIVVLAAGARSREIEGLPPEARPPVRPVKGQMLAVQMDPAAPLLRHVVWAPGAYLVPRLDGRLIVGATVEERGFDASLTAGAMLSLLDAAWRVLPAIEECAIVESWVGFRPGSPDDAPILGPTAVDGLIVATGHHRNGILLTPITADEVSRCVLTGEISEAIRAFGIERFPSVARQRHENRASQRV
ncbi:MAG TPA: glycine oxidase ThiO [Stellaceae bacterium]|nr:glycine oxidase ThiO [Stellaceae bacterium]